MFDLTFAQLWFGFIVIGFFVAMFSEFFRCLFDDLDKLIFKKGDKK